MLVAQPGDAVDYPTFRANIVDAAVGNYLPFVKVLPVTSKMIYVVIASATFLAVSSIALGRRRPEYSHIQHTISELGEHGCPVERLVAYGVFLPFGLAMAAIAIVMRSSEPVVLLAGWYGGGL